MYRTYTMQGLADESMASLSFMMTTLALAAGLALILGAVGLYGVLSYVVAQRSAEIGVRMALGAEAAQVRRMVVLEGARVVVLGAGLGLLAAAAASRALASLLFGIEPFDPMTFGVTTLLLLAVGALASYVPARRASTVDPLDAMRAT
jgi:ABC-type antimicrobial peptide transport system permease subunit